MKNIYLRAARARHFRPATVVGYLLLLLALQPWAARAQAPAFSTSRTTGITYSSIVTTGASFTFPSADTDDNTSNAVTLPAGFAFTYLGAAVTGFVVSPNGWLSLDPAVTFAAYTRANNFDNNLGKVIPKVLAPMWEDLVCQGNNGTTASLTASMKYLVSGTAPNRVLTVEWLGMEVYQNDGPNLNFQVKLYETTNVIQYLYGVMSGFDGRRDYNYTYSLGLTGSTPATSYIAQQTPNSNFFAQANATADNVGANGLNVVPTSFSQVQFVPAAALTTGSSPGAVVPANNEPAGALALPLIFFSPTSFATTYTSANATASAGITACGATTPGTPDDDVWFTFTLSRTQPVTVTLRGSGGYDGVLQVFSNAGTTALTCVNGTGSGLSENYSATLAAGTYYVRVYSAAVGSGTTGQFALAAYIEPPVPANNECAAAVALSSNGTCTPIDGTSLGATASTGVPACTGTPDDDVWYSFTTAATARSYTLTMQGSADYNGVVQVLSGACGSLTSVNCTNATLSGGAEVVTLSSLTPNTTYYVRVYEFASGYSSGDFTLCLTDNFPRITLFSPTSGPVGSSVTLTGTGLSGATGVSFNGTVQTTFTSNTAMGVVLNVPAGATTGTLTVTTPVGTSAASSQVFTVTPALISVAPNPGGLGQTITLTGTTLTSPTALTINGAAALAGIISNSGSSLVVRVPVTAAASGSVSITTAGGTATVPFTLMAAPGNALALDGTNDYVRSAAALPVTGEFTLESWVNPTVFSGGQNALVMAEGFPAGAMHCQFYGDNLGFSINGNNPTDVVSTSALPTGRWSHVAVVYSASARTVLIYVNGVLNTSRTYTSARALAALPYSIGAWISSGAQHVFNGKLDELRMYTAALTQAQVQADMISTSSALPASQTAYYNFDQGTPAGANGGLTTVYDLVSANPGILTNFALTGAVSNYVESYALVVPTATAATNRQPNSFTATWQASVAGTATSYVLDVATDAAFTVPVAGSPFSVTAPATSYTVTGVRNGGTYYYRVRALKAPLADQGAFSNTVTLATPLPVELTAFTATAEGTRTVRLNWTTASEKNSAYFDVERSLDGRTFTGIGQVVAAGTSSARQAYMLLDGQLPAGATLLYYRLRQVDTDNTVAFSPVQTITRAATALRLTLTPNPTTGSARLTGATPGAAVQVLDALGRLVHTSTADDLGTAVLTLPAGLPRGVYVVRAGFPTVRLVLE